MKTLFATIFFFLMITGTNFAQRQYRTTKFEDVKEIPAGKALIYFYGDPGTRMGNMFHYRINSNDSPIYNVNICKQGYFPYFAEPGEATFWGEFGGKRDELTLNIETGKTYIIKCSMKSSGWVGKPYLLIENPEKANKELRKCKLLIKEGEGL